MAGFLFFCDATGRPEIKAETRNRVTARTKIVFFAVFTAWIVREKERVCLARDQFNVALISRDRDRSPPVTDIADDSAPFAEEFHTVVPESTQRDFLDGRSRHQMKPTVGRELQSDIPLAGLEFIGAARGEFSVKENVAGRVRGKNAGRINPRQSDVA